MRRVNISSEEPQVLITARNKKGGERELAIIFHEAQPEGSYKKFSAYKDGEVKQSLNKLFHGKCAYCETKYIHVHPVDIEHYRPKGGFQMQRNGKLEKPGYYWLAAEWSNLLPTCIDCNRERNHCIRDGITIKTGKGNLFPIEDETKRVRNHNGNIAQERPLLINPYFDEPEDYLEFTIDGIVRPKVGNDNILKKAKESIEIYGLQRPHLVEERRMVCLSISTHFVRIKFIIEKIKQYPNDVSFEEELKKEIRQLMEFTRPNKPYSLMARQIIQRFKEKSDIII
ncbi:retron system putative HNH endonuclease [Bacillus cereus]|uniref:TIGR02646 family protein n=1 Tax=Bacillus cereus TaxID=1396 RepID=A0A1S9U465_BACCE|nr:retron system putative HNH endonuclease [Bacillus cereus]OOR17060.1 TIGR02646 family protein [Bacillus cereus]